MSFHKVVHLKFIPCYEPVFPQRMYVKFLKSVYFITIVVICFLIVVITSSRAKGNVDLAGPRGHSAVGLQGAGEATAGRL